MATTLACVAALCGASRSLCADVAGLLTSAGFYLGQPTSGNARPVWRGSPLTSFDSCKVGSFDHVRGWRRRMVDVAGDGTWSRVVRDIKDIVACALASLHRGGRPFAQSPDH